MKVKVKKLHEDAVVPQYAKAGDAGMDLTAVEISYDKDGNLVANTGLAFEIPDGYVGLIFPRSGNAKKALTLGNSVGVIDSGYRGPIIFKFKPVAQFNGNLPEGYNSDDAYKYDIGDRIGQIIIVPYPSIEIEEASELSDSDRGNSGFGSTGK